MRSPLGQYFGFNETRDQLMASSARFRQMSEENQLLTIQEFRSDCFHYGQLLNLYSKYKDASGIWASQGYTISDQELKDFEQYYPEVVGLYEKFYAQDNERVRLERIQYENRLKLREEREKERIKAEMENLKPSFKISKMQKIQTKNVSIINETLNTVNENAPVKRGRGRPRKIQQIPQTLIDENKDTKNQRKQLQKDVMVKKQKEDKKKEKKEKKIKKQVIKQKEEKEKKQKRQYRKRQKKTDQQILEAKQSEIVQNECVDKQQKCAVWPSQPAIGEDGCDMKEKKGEQESYEQELFIPIY